MDLPGSRERRPDEVGRSRTNVTTIGTCIWRSACPIGRLTGGRDQARPSREVLGARCRKSPGRVRSSAVSDRPRSCLPGGQSSERSCYPTPCGARFRHARRPVIPTVSHAGRPEASLVIVVTTMIPGLIAVLPRRSRGSPSFPEGPGRAFLSWGTQRRPDAAAHAPRSAQERGSAPDVRACAGALMRHQKARGNGQHDRARRGDEFRVVAKRVRKVLSDRDPPSRTGAICPRHGEHAARPCPERGHEPPHDGRPDAFGDQGVQESGHRCPGHTSLDATQRAGGRVIADDDEHGIGCQISNVLERVAQVGLDDDRVRLVHRHGIDQRVLRFGGRDDVKPTRPKPSLHVADAARRDHAESVAGRPRPAAGACGEAERWRIDMAVGSRWIVVDDLLYETP